MGYRSRVGEAISKIIWHKVNSEMKECLKDCYSISEDESAYFFNWDNVKWYDGYKDVDMVNKFVSDNCDLTGLLRIGEEEGDIERNGCPSDFGLYTSTSIDLPISTTVNAEDLFALNAVKFIKEITDEKEKS